jgi:hypothetical protein
LIPSLLCGEFAGYRGVLMLVGAFVNMNSVDSVFTSGIFQGSIKYILSEFSLIEIPTYIHGTR